MATLSEFEVKVALAAVARNANANGAAVDLRSTTHPGGRQMKAFIDVGAASGTTPTLDVKMQESADGSTGWADITGAAFAQKTAAGTEEIHFRTSKRYVRAVVTVGGTSPSFTFGVYIMGQKRLA